MKESEKGRIIVGYYSLDAFDRHRPYALEIAIQLTISI